MIDDSMDGGGGVELKTPSSNPRPFTRWCMEVTGALVPSSASGS
jgi:hypothetical protein